MAILNNQMVYIINMKWFTTMIYDMIITVTTQRSFLWSSKGRDGFFSGDNQYDLARCIWKWDWLD